MKCFTCKSNMKESKTSHFVDLKSCMVIVKNVPCLECEQCGEKYFTDEVAQRLDQIVESVYSLMSEITVIEYTQTVA